MVYRSRYKLSDWIVAYIRGRLAQRIFIYLFIIVSVVNGNAAEWRHLGNGNITMIW